MIPLPPDFREFLKLFNDHKVEYLLIGGYAVAYYGYIRATGDMDIWINISEQNALNVIKAMESFGFGKGTLPIELFLSEGQVVRMGMPPLKIEVCTSISGVEFDKCYASRNLVSLSGIEIPVINLEDLKINKKASGRLKDQIDLENLP